MSRFRAKESPAVCAAREAKRAHIRGCLICKAAEERHGVLCLVGLQLHRQIGRQERLQLTIRRR